ncbi:gamma-glutamyltransferase [Vacuolonema iberomarrocanum]|uniref:gamma-glutamyltransferase n=1 Tax=Vacuolonema iberomarrocanum TaxID=3454632 RepID=UPI001A03F718|nr:gamma-glutamyltransferase [filamentous cyanobacterium LEGE 07170]
MGKRRGAIAAGNPKTAAAGMEILNQGGNVFDAVVAAALAASVVESTLTSLGGGGFLLAHTQANENILFDFFAHTPRQKNPSSEFFPVDVDFGAVSQEFHVGLGSAAVPGMVKGLLHVHQRLGRLPLEAIAAPAIHYARDGFILNAFQTYCFKILCPILGKSPDLGSCVVPDGKPLPPGTLLRLPMMADTLEFLVKEGARGFYEGELAQQIANDSQERGGHLTLADLANYQVIERSPLTTTYHHHTLLTNPPPSSGGTLIAFALALLEPLNISALDFGALPHITQLAEAMRLTNQARAAGYDRHLYQPDIAQQFLAPDHLRPYLCQLTGATNKWGSTTHISALDAEGNAASLTSSNGEGAGYSIPGTGVMLNNMLGEADLHPNGFHQWDEDVRISSMMAPTMVLSNGQQNGSHPQKPELVLGSGGSNRIRTAILQVVSNLLDFRMSIDDAVASSRIHWENDVLNLEPGLSLPDPRPTTFPFDGRVMQWDERNMFFGGVHAVGMDTDGTLYGSGDPRRGGAIA